MRGESGYPLPPPPVQPNRHRQLDLLVERKVLRESLLVERKVLRENQLQRQVDLLVERKALREDPRPPTRSWSRAERYVREKSRHSQRPSRPQSPQAKGVKAQPRQAAPLVERNALRGNPRRQADLFVERKALREKPCHRHRRISVTRPSGLREMKLVSSWVHSSRIPTS